MYWPIVPVPGDCEDGEVGGIKCGWQGKPKYTEKTCPDAKGSVFGSVTTLQARGLPVRVPDKVDFLHFPNLSSRTMALGSTQPLTEMSTRNLSGGKKRPASRADNLAAICEPNV
jgi:hypothetical protein